MTDKLKQVIQDLINGRNEQAQASIHEYMVDKMKTAAGLNEDVKAAKALEKKVHSALDNSKDNGYEPEKTPDAELADDLTEFDAGLEDYGDDPTALIAHIKTWKDLNKIKENDTATKLNAVKEAKEVYPWAKSMMADSGLKGTPDYNMSDTGDGKYYSSEKADAAIKALKAAGHKVRTSGAWTAVTDKSNSKRGMTFDFDDVEAGGARNGKVAVRFFDESKDSAP